MNGPPEGAPDAVLEADLRGIAVWDVSHLLPRHKRKRYQKRGDATHLFVHHSGRAGAPGFAGLRNSTRYVVNHRNFPGCAYHLWVPQKPCFDEQGRLVCFRGNAPETRSWHTGGKLNTIGESIALQGNTTVDGLSESQKEILEALLPYRLESLSVLHLIDRPGGPPGNQMVYPTLSWHSEASRWGGKDKAACPGKEAVRWLTNYRYSSDWLGADHVTYTTC